MSHQMVPAPSSSCPAPSGSSPPPSSGGAYEEPSARAGPAHRPGVREPFVGSADRELGLGRPVELPHAARADALHDRPLHRGRARGPGMGQEAERIEDLVRAEPGRLQDPLEMGRDQEGGGRAQPAQHVQRGGGVETAENGAATRPRAACPHRSAPRRCGTAASRPCAGRAGSNCHTAASSSKTARAVPSSHSPVVTPLGCPVVPDV